VERIAKPAERGAALPVFLVCIKEGDMYAIIRRYNLKGSLDRKSIDDFKGRVESKYVPRVQDIRGFHSYCVVKVSEKELVSIGVFEDKAGATESSRLSADFLKNDPIKDQFSAPQITEGELLISREVPVTA
jgi:hypothetical protein